MKLIDELGHLSNSWHCKWKILVWKSMKLHFKIKLGSLKIAVMLMTIGKYFKSSQKDEWKKSRFKTLKKKEGRKMRRPYNTKRKKKRQEILLFFRRKKMFVRSHREDAELGIESQFSSCSKVEKIRIFLNSHYHSFVQIEMLVWISN